MSKKAAKQHRAPEPPAESVMVAKQKSDGGDVRLKLRWVLDDDGNLIGHTTWFKKKLAELAPSCSPDDIKKATKEIMKLAACDRIQSPASSLASQAQVSTGEPAANKENVPPG
jgi:hypothetical protein